MNDEPLYDAVVRELEIDPAEMPSLPSTAPPEAS